MPLPRPSPEELLERARRARSLARALLRDDATAEDVAQEAVMASLGAGAGAEPTWLARKVRSLVGHARRGRARRARHEAAAARPEPTPSTAELVEQAATLRTLVEAVIALEEPYRSAILRRYFDDQPPREIARIQRQPVSTVRTHLTRGLAQLRARLERELGPGRWAVLLAPLARIRAPLPPVPASTSVPTPLALATGGILVQTKLKLVVAAVATVVVAALAVVFRPGADAAQPKATAPGAEPELASVAGGGEASEELARTAPDSREERSQASVLAPKPAAGPREDPIDRDRDLFGEVVDLAGVPIPGAAVSVQREEASRAALFPVDDEPETLASTSTDDEGRFRLRLEPGPNYRLVVEHPFYATAEIPDRFAGEKVRVVLGAAASVFGRVLRDADGSAVAGAKVELIQRALGAEPWVHPVVHSTHSDEVGAYSIDGLTAGGYDVVVRCSHDPDLWGLSVLLTMGEAREKDLRIPVGASLSGHVLDADTGLGIEGAEVGRSWNFGGVVRTDVNGAFTLLGIDPKEDLTIIAGRAPGYAAAEVWLRQGEAIPADVHLLLAPELRARGRILDPSGRPIEGARVEAYGKANDPAIDPSESHVATVDRANARTGPDGRFELVGLSHAAHHSVVVRSPGCGRLVVDFPDSERDRPVLDLGDLTLFVAATLRGRVVDASGAPVPRAVVHLEGGDAGRARFSLRPSPEVDSYTTRQDLRVDDLGRFSATDLGPGVYHLFVNCSGVADSSETSLTLREGELRDDVELVLDVGSDANAIAGRVIGPDGAGLAGVHVEASRRGDLRGDQPVMRGNMLSRADGSFRLEALVPGVYALEADPWPPSSPQAQDAAPLRLEGVATGSLDIVLELPRRATIRGTVLRADGALSELCLVQVDYDSGTIGGMLAVATDAQGRFELPVPAGETVDLVALDYELGKTVRVHGIPAGTEGLILRLEP